MTLKQFIKRHGWCVECDTSIPYRAMNVNIHFTNPDGDDETQFSIHAWNVDELAELFNNFCSENNFRADTVNGVAVVEVAESLEKLS